MQALAAFREKAADYRIRLRRLKQLYARAVNGKHRHGHFLVRYGFTYRDLHAELALVESERGFNGFYGDAEVVNGKGGFGIWDLGFWFVRLRFA